MIRSLFTGATGLKGHQTRMDVIGNNIANVNTVGFKTGRATFEDMLSQTMRDATTSNGNVGSTNPKQVGLGTQIGAVDTLFRDGAPMVTGKDTDLCLSGDGLFIVRRGKDMYYTRDGAFSFDKEGNYVLPGSGHFVQGWMAKDGVIDPTAATEDIKIPYGKELQEAVEGPTITGIIAPTEHMDVSFGGKQFQVKVPSSGTWHFKDDVPLGAKTAVIEDESGNTETATLSPAATFEIPKGTSTNYHATVLTKGSLSEEYPLALKIDGQQFTAVAVDKDMYIPSDWVLKSGGATAGSNTITITDGTNDVTFTLNAPLKETLGETQLTQAVASPEHPVTLTLSDGTTVVKTDGTYAVGDATTVMKTVGVLQSVEIGASGIVTGIYSNGARRTEAQVAVAHFNNSPGLTKTGTSLYQESNNSGTPETIRSGEYGVTITPGALEMSNVDLAEEFSNMIITQRGFQSNSKIISVGDEMVKTAIDMKH